MKKNLLIILICIAVSFPAIAGGILTNTNQSARYVRLLANDASLDIDAVYYNPAGLSFLSDGFHISVNNQSIFQNKEIINSYAFLNHDSYLGDITAPLFPGIYAAYKTGKLVFSLGFNPIGGGGGTEFKEGLPSFETKIAELPTMLAPFNYDDSYTGDFYFSGTSVFWGLQLGITYEVCDYFSVFAGGRYIMAKNTYEGHIKDLTLFQKTADGIESIDANVAITGVSNYLAGASADLGTAATQMQALVDGGLGSLSPTDAHAAGYLTPEQFAGLDATYTALGLPTETPISTGQTSAAGASAQYGEQAVQYGAQAELLKDQEADAEEIGNGFTPIFGANIFLLEKKLNIGIKYEMKSEIELENNTAKDFILGFNEDGSLNTMFPDGAKKRSDMPAMLSVGASYKFGEKLTLHGGYHLYWDTEVDWEGKEESIDDNYWEGAAGIELKVAENLWISAGYLYAASGVSVGYQTDMSYSLSSSTVGFGGKFKVQDDFFINLGVLYTGYNTGEKTWDYNLDSNVKETYYKDNLIFAIGADIKLF